MATDIYSMLTGGYDPYEESRKREQAFQQRLGTATDPRSFIAAVGGNLGSQLGMGAQRLFGDQDQKAINDVMQQVNSIEDPIEQAKAAYRAFSERNMPKQAQLMLERIRTLQEEAVSQDYKKAQADYYRGRGTAGGKGTGAERMIQAIGDVRRRLMQGEDVPEWEITQANDYIEYLGKQKSYVDKEGNIITVSQSQISPLPPKKTTAPAAEAPPEAPRSAGAGRGFVNPPLIGATPSPVTETRPAATSTLAPGSGARVTTTPVGAQSAQKAATKEAFQTEQAKNVAATVDEALGQVSGWTAGLGSLLASVPGSPAADLEGTLTTIKANLGFDRLQQMRDASPTGGALGQVAIQELEALQATVASLKQGQSPEKLRSGLNKIKRHYENWLQVMQGNDPRKASEVPPAAKFKASKADLDLVNKYKRVQ